MDFLYRIAEQRIAEAIKNGELRNLKGEGKPIRFEEDFWIPDDLRIAYKFLKNAGCIPPELETRKEIVNLCTLIHTLDDNEERLKKIRELNFKLLKLNLARKRPLELEDFPEYESRVISKLSEGTL